MDGQEYEKFFDTYSAILLGSQVTVERGGRDTTLAIPVNFIDILKDHENAYFYYPRIPFVISAIPDTSLNASTGLRAGDVIRSVSGTPCLSSTTPSPS